MSFIQLDQVHSTSSKYFDKSVSESVNSMHLLCYNKYGVILVRIYNKTLGFLLHERITGCIFAISFFLQS